MLRIVAVRGPKAPQPRRGAGTWGTGSPEYVGHRHPAPHGGTRRCRPTIPYGLPIWFVGRDRGTGSPECAGHRHPAPHGGTRRCRPTIPYGLPIWFVGRDLCVPPGGWYMGYGFAGMCRSSSPRTARRHTQVPPYNPVRTAHMVRRAGPMCPAADTHRSKYFSQKHLQGMVSKLDTIPCFPLKEG